MQGQRQSAKTRRIGGERNDPAQRDGGVAAAGVEAVTRSERYTPG